MEENTVINEELREKLKGETPEIILPPPTVEYKENPSERVRPVSAWKYMWLSVLYGVPLIGFIFLVIHCFALKNVNLRSFARSRFLLGVFYFILIFVLIYGLGFVGGGFDFIFEILSNIG